MTKEKKIEKLIALRDLMYAHEFYFEASHDGVGDGTISISDTDTGDVIYSTELEFIHDTDIDKEITIQKHK